MALLERLETANKQDSAASAGFVDVGLLDGLRVMCESFGDQPDGKDVCPDLAKQLQPLMPFLNGAPGRFVRTLVTTMSAPTPNPDKYSGTVLQNVLL